MPTIPEPVVTENADYTIRLPRQKRSREAWARILTAGAELLREGGYEAFTIAAVCERAGVAPRALYERVDTKDALFLAVYEHGLAQVRGQMEQVFQKHPTSAPTPAQQVHRLVGDMADVFRDHQSFLKPVLLLSSTHPEIHRRGSAYSRQLGEGFVAVLRHLTTEIEHEDPESALRFCFGMVHSALVMRAMYGPGFAVPMVSHEQFAHSLIEAATRYLFARP